MLLRLVEPGQDTSRAFADACGRAGVIQSRSAVGSPADNALAESFDATCKRETLQGRSSWADEHEARLDLFRWLHRYNTRRRHSSLGQRSPTAYEAARDTPSTTLAPAAWPGSKTGPGPFVAPGVPHTACPDGLLPSRPYGIGRPDGERISVVIRRGPTVLLGRLRGCAAGGYTRGHQACRRGWPSGGQSFS
ncbi:integrase core domain-containing protein [Streptomyces griseoruber]|uniref:integrase core domain-containing protein n=1 Tax=Streptomyces griseoruber TaxID=1943 RepID=UPI000BFF75C0